MLFCKSDTYELHTKKHFPIFQIEKKFVVFFPHPHPDFVFLLAEPSSHTNTNTNTNTMRPNKVSTTKLVKKKGKIVKTPKSKALSKVHRLCKTLNDYNIYKAIAKWQKSESLQSDPKTIRKQLSKKKSDLCAHDIVYVALYALSNNEEVKEVLEEFRYQYGDRLYERVTASIQRVTYVTGSGRNDTPWTSDDDRWEIMFHVFHDTSTFMPIKQFVHELLRVYRRVSKAVSELYPSSPYFDNGNDIDIDSDIATDSDSDSDSDSDVDVNNKITRAVKVEAKSSPSPQESSPSLDGDGDNDNDNDSACATDDSQ